jgi:hypothetical protein
MHGQQNATGTRATTNPLARVLWLLVLFVPVVQVAEPKRAC